MDPNTHSVRPVASLTALATVVDRLAAQDLDGLSDAVRAERVLVLRRLVDRLEGHWLHELADLDARRAAGAEPGLQVGSTDTRPPPDRRHLALAACVHYNWRPGQPTAPSSRTPRIPHQSPGA
jgi:hypothetical protein